MHRTEAQQKLINHAAAQTTDMLMSALKVIDAKPWAEKTQEERLVAATISDVIVERHNLDAKIDEIYENAPEGVRISFYDAITTAMNS